MTLLSTSFPANISNAAVQAYENQNTTNGTDCPPGKHGGWVFVVIPVYMLLITVFGSVFNLFVLMVFCFNKKACTVPEIYLSNLAAADLVLVSSLPFWAVNVSNGFDWPFSATLCRLVSLSIGMNTYCSIYLLALISIDRFFALVHPLSHTRMRRPKYAKLGCLLVWVFSLLMNIPILMYRKVKYYPNINTTTCFLDYPNFFVYILYEGVLTMFTFIIPISIISFCSLKIIKTLKKRKNTLKKEMKATTLVLAVLLAFLVCWMPFHLVRIVQLLGEAGVFRQCKFEIIIDICRQVFIYLAFFNSVLNPVLYVIVGKNFRNKVKELFNQWSLREHTNTTSTSS